MKYGLISIDLNSVNLGNRLIEYSIVELLRLQNPSVVVPMFRTLVDQEINKLNKCDYVLLPGSTILAKGPGQSEALSRLKDIKVPVYCVGASGWGPDYPYYEEVIRYITPPVGCRDPATLQVCQDLGVDAIFTGCPTAYFGTRVYEQVVPYAVIGFARTHFDWQRNLFKQVQEKYMSLAASIQEPSVGDGFASHLRARKFYYDNPADVLKEYGGADEVYTGRLHGLLPALSQKKPVFFFGNPEDSRFSLLTHLRIPIHPIGEPITDIIMTTSDTYGGRLLLLKANFFTWSGKTVYKHE